MADEEHQLLDVSDDEATEIIGAAESIAMHNLSSVTSDAWHEHDDTTGRDSNFESDDERGVSATPSEAHERAFSPIPPPIMGKAYEDFSTIDWARDAAIEWSRQKALEKRKKRRGEHSRYASWYDASQGWIIVTLIGMTAGLTAGILDMAIAWIADLKQGVCPKAWFLSQKQCCWAQELMGDPDCEDWQTWAELFNATGAGGYMAQYFMYLLMSCVMAGLSAFLVKSLAIYAAGSGLAEIKVILGGFIIRGYFGFLTLIVKTFTLILAVGSGLNLGFEGPMVHISLCLGNVYTRLFSKYDRNEAKKRELLSASAAIGVAAAFNAPIGGVLFSLEEVSYYFPHKTMWRSFFGCLVAALVLSYMNPLSYRELSFEDRTWHWFELPAFVILGVFGGVFGAYFTVLNVKWCAYRKKAKVRMYPVAEVIAITLFTSVLAFPNWFARFTGVGLLMELFHDCEPGMDSLLCTVSRGSAIGMLIGTLIFKIVTVIITMGLKLPAGLLIPSLVVGALAGRVVGEVMQIIYLHNESNSVIAAACTGLSSCVTPSMYSMIGATASLAGVSRMTVALVVIMFELTGALKFILPYMIAAAIAKWVADAIFHEGIYDAHIQLNGFPYLDAKEEFHHYTKARDAMCPPEGSNTHLVCIPERSTIGELEPIFGHEVEGFPVVTSIDEMRVVGYVSKRELKSKMDFLCQRNKSVNTNTPCFFYSRSGEGVDRESGLDFYELIYNAPFEIPVNMPMVNVIELFRRMGMRFVLVTEKGRLVGIITKKDVLRHIAKMHHREQHELHAAALTVS